ncbi:MAG: FAD-dependent oxidoreductase [Thermostichales cyanobacterium SZTDM-1c_bins_54]
MANADVVVVGCGVIGAAIAWELSHAGLQVTVLEAGSPAQGASGAALGVVVGISSLLNGGAAARLRLRSWQLFDPMIERLEADLGYGLPVNRQGLLHVLWTEAELERWQPTLAARPQLQLLDAQHLHESFPSLAPELLAGVYAPQDRQIAPRLLTAALVKAASQLGCQFHFHTPLLHWQTQGSRITTLHTPQGSLSPGWVVVAAGLGSSPLTGIPVQGVKGQALTLYAPELGWGPVVTGQDLHLVPRPEGCWWVGATVEFAWEQPAPTPETIPELRRRAAQICPALAQAPVIEHWAGLRPRPQQRAPLLGSPPGWENLLLATGHYRNGVLLAPVTAAVIRDVIVHGQTQECQIEDFLPSSPHRS